MARSPRLDAPGSWHHVMNRAVAKRPLFEGRNDIRFFLSRLARAVRRRELEVHAYSVLTTHFHLLVRSPKGKLSRVMRDAQLEHSRRFNRRRRRDGPLLRGRFKSRWVDCDDYQFTLVGYIDANATKAGLAERASDYPYSSAWHYARASGPPWLARGWVEGEVRRLSRSTMFSSNSYARVFSRGFPAHRFELVERRILAPSSEKDPLVDLIAAAPEQVLAWMRRKARLADGTRPGIPVSSAACISDLVRQRRERQGGYDISGPKKTFDGWKHLEIGLLRDLAGCTYKETATRVGSRLHNVIHALERHREWVLKDPDYGSQAARLAAEAIRSSTSFDAKS